LKAAGERSGAGFGFLFDFIGVGCRFPFATRITKPMQKKGDTN